MRRVVVTGAGALTPHGDLAATLRAVERRIPPPLSEIYVPARWGSRVAAVPEFDERAFFRTPKSMKVADRRTRLLVAVASMALSSAGLGVVDSDRAAVIVGTSGSDLQAEDLARAISGIEADDMPSFAERILSRLNPLWLLVNLPNMAAAHVSIQFGFKGPNNTIMSDWMAGLQAIGEACDLIRSGEAELALAGGAETSLIPFALAALADAGVLDEGFVAAEGAAVVVLEEKERARRRGATVLGEVIGQGSSAVSIEESLRSCGVAGNGSRFVIRGAATREQSRQEIDAISSVLSDRTPTDEFRSSVGHSLGAAGAIDFAIAVSRYSDATVFCNSMGFMGQCASVAFWPRGV